MPTQLNSVKRKNNFSVSSCFSYLFTQRGSGVFLFLMAALAVGSLSVYHATPGVPIPFDALSQHHASSGPDTLRVGIMGNGMTDFRHENVTFRPYQPGSQLIVTDEAGRGRLRTANPVTIAWHGGHWLINGQPDVMPYAKLMVYVEPADGLIQLPHLKRPGSPNPPYYRGSFELQPKAENLMLINCIGMQDYLNAVVPNEMPIRFGIEALKAQAVVARNYALRPRDTFWKEFDICDSQYCQAYYGAQTETPASRQALADTEGLVLLYQNELALTVFSSTNGGYSEAYENVFSDVKTKMFPALMRFPYLMARPDNLVAAGATGGGLQGERALADLSGESAARAFWTRRDLPSYDSASPYYRWRKQWNTPQLAHDVMNGLLQVSRDGATRDFVSPRLGSAAGFGHLLGIRVVQRGRSGKAMQLQVTTSTGVWQVRKEFLIRQVLNQAGKRLPSANMVLSETHAPDGTLTGLIAEGGGFGHGVGLSQFGAYGMARQGLSFQRILAQYYPGCVLGTRPVTGEGIAAASPVRMRFYVPLDVHQGRLWVKIAGLRRPSHEPDGLWVNGQPLRTDKTAQHHPGYASAVPVALKPGAENELAVQDPQLTAWITFEP